MAEINYYETENNQSIHTLVLSDEGKSLTAFWVRHLCGYGLDTSFDPIYVLENVIPQFDSSFNYVIIEENEWDYGDSVHAFYTPVENTITVRCDIYDQALDGFNMAQITITHEIVHYFQSAIVTFLQAFQCTNFKTELCEVNSDQMIRHEEQTDSITSLVLIPKQFTEGKTDDEIFYNFIEKPIKLFVLELAKTLFKDFLDISENLQLSKFPKQIAS
jgi:hypothetical protein